MNETEKIVETVSLRDQMTEIIRKMIIRGELAENEPISERKLSLQFGISTTPIKEALRMLQAEGLVYVKPRSGTYVSEVSRDKLIQICYMRASLEGVAAYFAAQSRTEDDLKAMRQRLQKVEAIFCAGGELKEIQHHNRRFHHILRESCRNRYLINLIERMNSFENTVRSLLFENQVMEKEYHQEHERHLEIYTAVEAQDPSLAERLMTEHIRRNYIFLSQL